MKNFFKILPLFMLALLATLTGCARTASISLEAQSPSATGNVRIQYSNYFTNGFRDVGKFIYFFQQQNISHNVPAGYSHTVYLKALGGTIESGSKSAYTWTVSGLPAWLSLDEDSSSFMLKTTALPMVTGAITITITAKSNENKQSSVTTKIIVLNNAQNGSGEPIATNAYSANNTLRTSESETPDADVLNTGADLNVNGSCMLSGEGYQAILPTQELSAYAGKLGEDCYAFHVSGNEFLVSFTVRSLETDNVINSCAISGPTHANCDSVILFEEFAPLKAEWSGSANMHEKTRETGMYFRRRVNDSLFYEIPFLGNSIRSPLLEKVSSTPLIWRLSLSFDQSNAMLNTQSLTKDKVCDPGKTIFAETLCLDNPALAGDQAWYLEPGWYYIRIKTNRTDSNEKQRYSIRYDLDLN